MLSRSLRRLLPPSSEPAQVSRCHLACSTPLLHSFAYPLKIGMHESDTVNASVEICPRHRPNRSSAASSSDSSTPYALCSFYAVAKHKRLRLPTVFTPRNVTLNSQASGRSTPSPETTLATMCSQTAVSACTPPRSPWPGRRGSCYISSCLLNFLHASNLH